MLQPTPTLPGEDMQLVLIIIIKNDVVMMYQIWSSSFMPNEAYKSVRHFVIIICHYVVIFFQLYQDENQKKYFAEKGRPLLIDYGQLEMDKKVHTVQLNI